MKFLKLKIAQYLWHGSCDHSISFSFSEKKWVYSIRWFVKNMVFLGTSKIRMWGCPPSITRRVMKFFIGNTLKCFRSISSVLCFCVFISLVSCLYPIYLICLSQVRGSIPLLWEQIVDLTYKPKFGIVRPEEAVSFVVICSLIALFDVNQMLSTCLWLWCTYAASSSWAAFSGFKKKIWGCLCCWSCQQGTYFLPCAMNFCGITYMIFYLTNQLHNFSTS